GVLAPIATSTTASPATLSLYARALAAVGEGTQARAFHEQACAAAPDDAGIAAARLADALSIAEDPATVDAWIADWVERLSPPRKIARVPAQRKLVIGYAVSALVDPREATAIAAVAQAHDRSRVTVIGYGIGAQSWRENTPFNGAFDKWRDVAGLDPATLARILGGDGLAVVIDCSGAAAPRQLMAIGRLTSAIRVSWLGVPDALGAPLYDAALGRRAPGIPSWGADAPLYPLVRDWARPLERTPSAVMRFASDVRLNQLDARTIALWSAVLSGSPGATLLLRANDMAAAANVERLIARFGRELAARIDLIEAATPNDFYRDADVALAPVNGTSARMTAEAIACGLPVVALDGAGAGELYGAFLRQLGLGGSLVAADDRDYVSIALGLAGSATAREQVAAQVTAVARSGQETARRIAEVIEREALAMISGDVLS
ncbi:MAG TPA: glycosyltransferase, partial [Stellaceae bacterium]|nr:glycosyltransferase [Stellaceae bacterium]